jgi:oxygen-independent coproporphyrinogen-3 oxidase
LPGIYLHIPFCRQACTYCDFYFSTSLSNKETVIKSIVKEAELRASYLDNKNLSSIYFGGGTPSLLSKQDLERIFDVLGKHFFWSKDTEITLEANPDDISLVSLKDWKETGINRLSIGLQSFNDEELKWMNRAHTAEESLASVKLAQDAGFNNITIDLIYGSKFQSIITWEETLKKAVDLETQHISSYNLTIENKTALGVNYTKGKEPAVNDELSSLQFLMMADELSRAGFIHYEISNFGKEGFFAQHNSNYWLQKHYLGLGPSAHSFNGVSRQWNIKSNNQYITCLNEGRSFFEKEELSLNDRYNEYVLTRLRTIWGCDIQEIEDQFGKKISDHFKSSVRNNKNYLQEKKGIFTLNKQAKLLADGIAADLFI